MPANPNNEGYWVRSGTILPPFALGKVAGTAKFGYWARNGAMMFPAAIQSAAAAPAGAAQPLVMII